MKSAPPILCGEGCTLNKTKKNLSPPPGVFLGFLKLMTYVYDNSAINHILEYLHGRLLAMYRTAFSA